MLLFNKALPIKYNRLIFIIVDKHKSTVFCATSIFVTVFMLLFCHLHLTYTINAPAWFNPLTSEPARVGVLWFRWLRWGSGSVGGRLMQWMVGSGQGAVGSDGELVSLCFATPHPPRKAPVTVVPNFEEKAE